MSFDTTKCGDRIEVRASYIAFRDDQPTFDDFIDVAVDHIIPFCLPRSEIRAARDALCKGDHVAAGRTMTRLSEKARALFIKAKKGSHRSGEAGEIVLYILNEWILRAPQIVSKMYLKTNNQMPVHGTDGIHARYDDSSKKLYLYWGESKAHANLKSALASALDSISDFVQNAHEKREIEIVAAYADLDGLDNKSKEAILRYLDPYDENSNDRVASHSCLLIFQYAKPPEAKPGKAEAAFREMVQATLENFVADIKKVVEGKNLSPQRFEFFLLPVPSVQDFRDKFQSKIGWPHD